MARQFRGRGSLPAPKRQIANEGVAGFGQITFLATTIGSILGSFGQQVIVPAVTLVRTRGLFSILVTNSGTSDAIIQVTMGIIVVQLEAFNAGLLSIPTPRTDRDRPWVVWQNLHVVAVAANPDQGAFGTFASQAVDSRGMRKMKSDEVLAVVFEGEQLSATTGTVVNCAYGLRNQFKL